MWSKGRAYMLFSLCRKTFLFSKDKKEPDQVSGASNSNRKEWRYDKVVVQLNWYWFSCIWFCNLLWQLNCLRDKLEEKKPKDLLIQLSTPYAIDRSKLTKLYNVQEKITSLEDLIGVRQKKNRNWWEMLRKTRLLL